MSDFFINRRCEVEIRAEDAMTRPGILTGWRDYLAIRRHGAANRYPIRAAD